MSSFEFSDAEVTQEPGFGLGATPEECVDFRYQAISIIDAVARGAEFDRLRAVALQPDTEYAKAVIIHSGRRVRDDSSVLFIGYKHDGAVVLFGHGSTAYDDAYREFYCSVYPDQAFGSEGIGITSAGRPEVAIRRMKEKGLNSWRHTLEGLGEPLPAKPHGSERGLVARFLLRNS